jgi:Tfp pilus assembly protein PilF
MRMSAQPLTCVHCQLDCVIDGIGPSLTKDDETTYTVAWRCPLCSKRSLDVCPVGPLVPSASTCLNCGLPYPESPAEARCSGCGLDREGARAALGVTTVPADPVAAARAAFFRGLSRHGLAILNAALIENPGLGEAWAIKCSFLDQLRYVNAKCKLLEGALAAGGPVSLWVRYGYALQQLGRHQDAVAAYRRYLQEDPNGSAVSVACGNLANSLALLGEHDAAEELYRRAMTLEPNNLTHDTNYTRFLCDRGRWEEALVVIKAGLGKTTEPAQLIPLLEDQAFIYAEHQHGAEALASAEAALARGSQSVRAHFLRGRALALLGRLVEARSEMERVLAMDPNNADGQRALQMIDDTLVWGRPMG